MPDFVKIPKIVAVTVVAFFLLFSFISMQVYADADGGDGTGADSGAADSSSADSGPSGDESSSGCPPYCPNDYCGNGWCGPTENCNTGSSGYCSQDCCSSFPFIDVSCKNNEPKVVLSYDVCSGHQSQNMEWNFWENGKQPVYDSNQRLIVQDPAKEGWVAGTGACQDTIDWSSDAPKPRYEYHGQSTLIDPNALPLNNHTYAWDVALPNNHWSPIIKGVFITPDCGGSTICSPSTDPAKNKGDINYLECSGLEYLSDGNQWKKCQPLPFWAQTVSGHEYKCASTGKQSIAECCGDDSCKSKTDGKRLSTGDSIVLGSSSGPTQPPEQKYDYTKERLWATGINNPVYCNGNDTRVSCEDKGIGSNHKCEMLGTNGCNAREDVGNSGTAGCKITCQREDGCSYKKSIEFVEEIGVFAKQDGHSVCTETLGPQWIIFGWNFDTNQAYCKKFKTFEYIEGQTPLTIIDNVQALHQQFQSGDCASNFGSGWSEISRDSGLKNIYCAHKTTINYLSGSFQEKLSDDIKIVYGFSGGQVCSQLGSGWSGIDNQYCIHSKSVSLDKGLNNGCRGMKGSLTVSPSVVVQGKDSLTIKLVNATPNSNISSYQSIDGTPDLDGKIIGKTDSKGNWSSFVNDTSGLKIGAYSSYVKVNGTKSNTVEWEVIGFSNSPNKTFYCRSDSKFVTDLDTAEAQSTCEKAGLTWTGALCCSEADDPHEYYNDPGGIGGCWDKEYIESVSFVNNTNESVINYNGTFNGCAIEAKNFNKANDALLQVKDTHTNKNLIMNRPYCYVEPRGIYYCDYTEKWLLAMDETDLNLSYAPPSNTSSGVGNSSIAAGCCPGGKCWDGNKCIDNQNSNPNSQPINGFRCINGNWTKSTLKFTPDGSLSGYCPKESQCLLNPLEQDVQKQCIESNQYVIEPLEFSVDDNYCENGKWTSRTKLLALKMMKLKSSPYTLFCDNKENTLNNLNYLAGSDKIVSDILMDLKTNNFCVLKFGNSTYVGTTINSDLDNASSENLNIFGVTSCKTASNGTQYVSCDQGKKVWYNEKLRSIIYSKTSITIPSDSDYLSQFDQLIGTPIKNIVKSINTSIPNPPADKSYQNAFKRFDRLYFSDQLDKSVIGAVDGLQFKNAVVAYKNLNDDLCTYADQYNNTNKDAFSGIACSKESANQYILAQGDVLTNVDPSQIWADLTAKLRLK